MRRTTVWVLVFLGFALACGDDDEPVVEPEPDPVALPAPDLRLLVLTDLDGTLEPCGCTSRPLGGIDRTVARAATLGEEAPTLMLAVGNLLFEHPHGSVDPGEPLLWQAETLLGVLQDAGIDAVTPGPDDLQRGRGTFDTLRQSAEFPFLAAGWSVGESDAGEENDDEESDTTPLLGAHVLEAGEHRVGIVGVSTLPADAPLSAPDPLEAARAALASLPDEVTLRVVMVQGDRRLGRRIASLEGVDFVLQGGLDQAEALPPAEAGNGWILNGGRQGQGLLVLDLYLRDDGSFADLSAWSRQVQAQRLDDEIEDLTERLAAWRAEGANPDDLRRQEARLVRLSQERNGLGQATLPNGGNAFAARWEAMDPDAPKDAAVERRLGTLARRINDHNREAFADRAPPPVTEGEAHYVGSAACASCHQPAYQWWQQHPHGNAYETLTERNREFHLACVGCHVTGYERPGGSTVTHNADGALVNVGCEVCHGPGSNHIAGPNPSNIRRETEERLCTTCHNEEHSDLFSYDAYRGTLLVPGHGRPLNGSEGE